jgi:hypothetical protein
MALFNPARSWPPANSTEGFQPPSIAALLSRAETRQQEGNLRGFAAKGGNLRGFAAWLRSPLPGFGWKFAYGKLHGMVTAARYPA